MIKYFVKKLLTLIPILLGITSLTFLLGLKAPGDPVEAILNPDGTQIVSKQEYERVKEKLGLDQPFSVQYVKWLKNVMHGEFGQSFFTNKSIVEQIMYRFPFTLKLAMLGMVFTIVFGIGGGMIMASYQDSWRDHFLTFVSTLFLSIPGFWLAIMMILLFSEILHLLPSSGFHGFSSYIMPAITISISTIGVCARLTKTAILDELGKLYVLVARAKGLARKKVIFRHAVRNSLIPITTFLGNYFAGVLGGSAIAEVIFNIPGLGSYAVSAVQSKDYLVVQAYVLISGMIYVAMTILIDLLYVMINPKLRVGEKR